MRIGLGKKYERDASSPKRQLFVKVLAALKLKFAGAHSHIR